MNIEILNKGKSGHQSQKGLFIGAPAANKALKRTGKGRGFFDQRRLAYFLGL